MFARGSQIGLDIHVRMWYENNVDDDNDDDDEENGGEWLYEKKLFKTKSNWKPAVMATLFDMLRHACCN
jgi:hypothetical protein